MKFLFIGCLGNCVQHEQFIYKFYIVPIKYFSVTVGAGVSGERVVCRAVCILVRVLCGPSQCVPLVHVGRYDACRWCPQHMHKYYRCFRWVPRALRFCLRQAGNPNRNVCHCTYKMSYERYIRHCSAPPKITNWLWHNFLLCCSVVYVM